jgi:hypothetical protein
MLRRISLLVFAEPGFDPLFNTCDLFVEFQDGVCESGHELSADVLGLHCDVLGAGRCDGFSGDGL